MPPVLLFESNENEPHYGLTPLFVPSFSWLCLLKTPPKPGPHFIGKLPPASRARTCAAEKFLAQVTVARYELNYFRPVYLLKGTKMNQNYGLKPFMASNERWWLRKANQDEIQTADPAHIRKLPARPSDDNRPLFR